MLHYKGRVKGRMKREGKGLHIMQLGGVTKALQGSLNGCKQTQQVHKLKHSLPLTTDRLMAFKSLFSHSRIIQFHVNVGVLHCQ